VKVSKLKEGEGDSGHRTVVSTRPALIRVKEDRRVTKEGPRRGKNILTEKVVAKECRRPVRPVNKKPGPISGRTRCTTPYRTVQTKDLTGQALKGKGYPQWGVTGSGPKVMQWRSDRKGKDTGGRANPVSRPFELF